MDAKAHQNPRQPAPELLAQLFERHAAALVLYARQLCACPEDVVQEAFIQLANQRETPQETSAWLYRVVRNRALNAARDAGRRRKLNAVWTPSGDGWFVENHASRIDGEAAANALSCLDQQSREVVVAHVWGGMTFAEIGRLLDVSDSTAHRRYQEALGALRQKLGEACTVNSPRNSQL